MIRIKWFGSAESVLAEMKTRQMNPLINKQINGNYLAWFGSGARGAPSLSMPNI